MRYLPYFIYHLSFHLPIFRFSNRKIRWKMENGEWRIQRGQSLFEVVVALAISALIIGAIVSLVTNSIRNSTFSKNQSMAASYSQQATEWLRGQRDADIETFIVNAGIGTWCLSASTLPATSVPLNWTGENIHPGLCSDSETIPGTPLVREASFAVTRQLGIKGVDVAIVEVDVNVSWSDSQGTHRVTNSTNFSDWRQR